MRILLLDIGSSLMGAVKAHLTACGFRIEYAQDRYVGLQLTAGGHLDGLVLKTQLPLTEELALCGQLRNAGGPKLPLILLGTSTSLEDKLAAFAAGVDDYLPGPLDPRELEARIRAMNRRVRARDAEAILAVADLQHNPATCETWRSGRPVRLGRAGRRILELLMRESPKVVTRQRLEFEIWGNEVPQRDLLRSHLSTLRLAVDGGDAPKLIHTVHRVGIRLTYKP